MRIITRMVDTVGKQKVAKRIKASSQTEIAKALGVNQSTVSRIASGARPELFVVLRLVALFPEFDVSDFLTAGEQAKVGLAATKKAG